MYSLRTFCFKIYLKRGRSAKTFRPFITKDLTNKKAIILLSQEPPFFVSDLITIFIFQDKLLFYEYNHLYIDCIFLYTNDCTVFIHYNNFKLDMCYSEVP